MSQEAMKLALDEIKNQKAELEEVGITDHSLDEIIKALEEALAKQEQDAPVGQLLEDAFGRGQVMWFNKPEDESMLYTTPQQRTAAEGEDTCRVWAGLTDEEIDQGLLRSDYALKTAHAWRAGVVFAMTKLKEKNT